MTAGRSAFNLKRIAAPAALACALLPQTPFAGDIPLTQRQSTYDIMAPQTRAMQDDDTANPSMFWLLDGEALWSARPPGQKSCADCHGDAAVSMKGVAAQLPNHDAARNAVVDLEARINICRSEKQGQPALAPESKELLALSTLVARQSRGMPITPAASPWMQGAVAQGREIFSRRQGQLNLSCAICHDDNWGQKLAGAAIPQAHPTGYPQYRLEWQTLGSLQRRLRNCMSGMRAQPYDAGAPEMLALEAFLMWRARDMKMDAPAVRP